jgi:hypothetical protein
MDFLGYAALWLAFLAIFGGAVLIGRRLKHCRKVTWPDED